jgi:diacylglycerol kinase (ATP)
MTRTIHIIVNPAAGHDDAVLAILNRAFHEKDIEWGISITRKEGDGSRLAEEALARGDVDIVAAYGGDGTVGEVAIALAGTDMPLAVLAGGTGNAFARALRIPLHLAEAAAMLADEHAHHVEAVDIGDVNGSPSFIVGGATGLIADAIEGASREVKDRLGMSAYTAGLLHEILNAESVIYHLTLDGEAVEAQGISLFVTNAGGFSMQGISFFDFVDMQDGKLDVFLIKDNRANTILSALVEASPLNLPWAELPHWQAHAICIDADKEGYVFSYDGSKHLALPVEVTARPRALRVIVPLDPAK